MKVNDQDNANTNERPKTTETVLVAANKRIQKQWEKDYPGIKVILQSEYRGYPLPTALTHYLGVQDIETDESSL